MQNIPTEEEPIMNDLFSGGRPDFPAGVQAELRLQRNLTRSIRLVSGSVTENVRADESGVSARCCRDGMYGFASNSDLTVEAAQAALRTASDNAAFLVRHAGAKRGALPSLPRGSVTPIRTYPDLEQKYYLDYLRNLDAYIVAHCPGLISRSLRLRHESVEKRLFTADAHDSHSILPRTHVYVWMTAETPNGQPVELYTSVGGLGVLSEQFPDPAQVYPAIDELYEKVMRKREGVYAEAGVKTVVFGPEMSGILAHEAVGHTVESDLVLGGSVAGSNLNKPVASELVTLVDFANTAFGETAPQPIYVDDEGTPAQDAVIIRNGILVGYLNSRETAAHFGMEPLGNMRAWSYSDEPLIRMRNTAILPGQDKLADMIASVDDGYYLIDFNNGQADLTGEFMFGICHGYEIKHGKLGRPILDTTISGVAFEMLKTVDMVSDDMSWCSGGTCGKKQPMAVGMGGPALRCKIMIGGR
jgi:TldD protein